MLSIKRLSRLTWALTSNINLRLSLTLRGYSKCATSIPEVSPTLNVPVAELNTPEDNPLNQVLIRYVQKNQSARATSFGTLLAQLDARANVQLPHVLPYESGGRQNVTSNSDLARGIVTIAHVLPATDKVIVASGFAILDGGLIVTCAHTFYQAAQHLPSSKLDQQAKSVVVTAEGELIGVASVESHLVHSDLVLLRLQDERKVSSLAVDPHPAPILTSLLAYEFVTASLTPAFRPTIAYAWKPAEVLFYRGPCGQEAETGTYDALSSMMHSHPSSNGSSGGPIVSKATNSVVGIVRGNEVSYANRRLMGFAIPSEHLFEAFKLPGMPDGVD